VQNSRESKGKNNKNGATGVVPNSGIFSNNNEGQSLRISEQIEEGQRKTITRTFRLYEELSSSFEKHVGEMNTTQTNLMNEILRQYLYWTSFIINHDSPFLTFDSATLIEFMENVDDSKLEAIAKGTATVGATDFIKFRWKKVNFANLVRYLELISSYANIGSISIAETNGEGNGDEERKVGNKNSKDGSQRYEIALRHHLGKKWSTFMAMFISNLFVTCISRTEASFETSNKSCFVYVTMAINR
jgi:hypothetical protein